MAEKDGVSVEVIDPRTLRPFDAATVIASVRKTRKAIVVHEAVRFGGIGAEISSIITEALFHELDAPVMRLCGSDVPIPYSAALEPHVVPTDEQIHHAITAMTTGKGRQDAG
jgi:pyruvate dehydrogenase E1 component beta subunit